MIEIEVEDWFASQSGKFMQPQWGFFGERDAAELGEDGDGDPYTDAGWYARLSAPGFSDCTEWAGPFPSEDAAKLHLYQVFCE